MTLMCLIIFFYKCNEKKKKELEHDFFLKQLNNNPKMKNLKFFTCKKHDALTWKYPWIDIKLHDLNF
jgi:hypothetical protein